MGNYSKMLKYYKEKGLFSEAKMWESVDCLDELLVEVEDKNPGLFWDFMRDQHEIFCGPHFDDKFGKWQIEQMYHKGEDGKKYEGLHWSEDDMKLVFDKHKSSLPSGTTFWDVSVAITGNWHDKVDLFKKWFPENHEEKIIEDALCFYFKDVDAPDGKVWRYMIAMDK